MKIENLSWDGRNYAMFTIDELLEAGVPQEAIDKHFAGVRLSQVKAECRRRIYAVASAETQMNMATAASMIAAKPVSTRSETEKDALDATSLVLVWVGQMRARVAMLASDSKADLTLDDSWPVCPPEVLALVSRF